jgi:2-dehydropantoate 2-reductase
MNPSGNQPGQAGETLNLLIFGAGAIGTFIGGSLALAGQRVVFLERPEIVDVIRKRGLHLSLDGTDQRLLSPQVVGSLSEALDQGPYEAAVFALKSYDTRTAIQMIAAFDPQVPPLLCLQNGVENETALAAALGSERVIAGSVTSSIRRRAAGDVVLERRRGIAVAAGHPLSQRLVGAFNNAGLNARLYPRPDDMKWSKLLTNLLANASSAILEMTPAEIFSQAGLFKLEIQQLREALQVMAVQGIHVVNLPGTPVRLLSLAAQNLPLSLARLFMVRAVGSGRGAKMPSLYIDLHSGKGASEVDYLNGAVVRFGKRMGIDTPINRFLNETLSALTRGEIPVEEFARQPEKLLGIMKD